MKDEKLNFVFCSSCQEKSKGVEIPWSDYCDGCKNNYDTIDKLNNLRKDENYYAKKWSLSLDEVVYCDDTKIIFKTHSQIYIGKMDLNQIHSSSYTSEKIIATCNEFVLQARTY